ncbi:hypothetical protein Cni_G17528 [Canna indica]|uniref:Uncharacterized protein n=1 Tax=Canna indica TaxID=4628 RepID=A0AAQ3QHU3_9LILI|nr:hypothetical protein Cni_G17528 [Canna indica]
MKVVIPVQDINYGAMATAYDSAPSSPKHIIDDDSYDLYCHCTSAPTSPTRAAAIYEHFSTSGVPFNWEEKPGTPKSHLVDGHSGDERRFPFGRPEKVEAAEDETVEQKGVLPVLKPPPRLQFPATDDRSSVASSSPRSPRPRGFWPSGHQRKGGEGEEELDPFTVAMMKATGEKVPPPHPSFVSSSTRGGSSKWRLRELLLFRSASRDFLSKYAMLSSSSNKKVTALEARNADEAAIAEEEEEELKKKTALRHRQGLLSCIRFRSGGHVYPFRRSR